LDRQQYNRDMTDHKKPGVGFWATVVLAILVLYVLSIGPACWISSRTNAGGPAVSVVYRPLTWGMSRSERIADACSWYSELGAANDWRWVRSRIAKNPILNWEPEADGLDKWLYSPKYKAINRNLGVD
jgi:hypothetical protein